MLAAQEKLESFPSNASSTTPWSFAFPKFILSRYACPVSATGKGYRAIDYQHQPANTVLQTGALLSSLDAVQVFYR